MGTKRDVYNHLGVKIGVLELPYTTTEEEWTARLAEYSADPSVEVIPPSVTPRQIRQALVISGVSISSIEAAINSLPEPKKSLALIEWEYSTAFIRTNPLVSQIGLILSWNKAQLDDLWKLAGSL